MPLSMHLAINTSTSLFDHCEHPVDMVSQRSQQHYANFFYGPVASKKSSFCIQATWRWYNNEYTPFDSDFGSCAYQGTTRGWGLEIHFFIPNDPDVNIYSLQETTTTQDFPVNGLMSLIPPVELMSLKLMTILTTSCAKARLF